VHANTMLPWGKCTVPRSGDGETVPVSRHRSTRGTDVDAMSYPGDVETPARCSR
jgi:hypothetical protein